MNTIKVIVVVLIMSIFFIFPVQAEAKTRDNLYALLEDQSKVRTYVEEIKDSSGEASGMTIPIRNTLLNALETRMTITFVLVNEKEVSDLVIRCDIKKFSDTKGKLSIKAEFEVEKGPQKILFRSASNFLKKRKILWSETLQETIKKGNMDQDQAYAYLSDELIEEFMKRCFSSNSEIIG